MLENPFNIVIIAGKMKQKETSLISPLELLRLQRDLGIALNSTGSLSEVLRLLLDALFKSREIEAACIAIYGNASDEIVLESNKGFPMTVLDRVRKTVLHDPAIFTDNMNSFYTPIPDISTLIDEDDNNPFISMGLVPLVSTGKLLGSIIIASRSREKMSIECKYIIETIATRVSGIITRINGEENLKRTNHILADLNTRLKTSEERYRQVLENQTDLISRFYRDRTISYANSAYCRFFNVTREQIVGKVFVPNIHRDDRERTQIHLHSLGPDRQTATIENRIILDDGSVRWVDWTDRAIMADDGTIIEYQSVGRDVTERKTLEERLQFMSLHDALTGLHNRAYFDEQMKMLADGRYLPAGIIVCDLNALKIVNDALGHQMGDTLLVTVSSVLRSCFRGSDIVARIGGDEFAILLPNATKDSVIQTVERIKKTIHVQRENNPDVPLSLSIGFAVRTKKSTTMEEIFAEADDAMYQEKENQRDFTRGLVLTSLLRSIDRLEPYRSDHMTRVRDYALAFATELNLPEKEIKRLHLASRYHDIGMISIPKDILMKTDFLRPDEEETLKRHVDFGARIAEAHPFLRDIAQVIQHHHEKWNGKGYPSGLAGDDIPYLSRIISICDAYDSMTTHPLYHPLKTKNQALDEIAGLSGIQFDPFLSPLFVGLMKRGAIGVQS